MWRSFTYLSPRTLDEAVAALQQRGAHALAGGTDFVVHLRSGVARPTQVVDLHDLGLAYVREDDGKVTIGALTTFNEILASPVLHREVPALVEAAAHVGATQCRNMATIGGNLCSAVPSADSAPPLLVREATLRVVGPVGERTLPVADLFAGPKKTTLQPGEILTEIQVPRRPANSGEAFVKLGRRQAMTLAIVNAAAYLEVNPEDGRVKVARIALGAVAPTPIRARSAEAHLVGYPFSEDRAREAARLAASESRPISDLRASAAYRRQVSAVLVYRALIEAWRRATNEAAFHLPPYVVSVSATVSQPRRAVYTPNAPNEITVNNRVYQVRFAPGTLLLELLRDHLGLTGTKLGCGTGECGACTVLLDGKPVNSCLVLAAQAVGRGVQTVEGLGTPERLLPLQEAFVRHAALQCGYCGPGVLMTAHALLKTVPEPTEQQVRYAIAGNLCRCSGYVKMVKAIVAAARHAQPHQEVTP